MHPYKKVSTVETSKMTEGSGCRSSIFCQIFSLQGKQSECVEAHGCSFVCLFVPRKASAKMLQIVFLIWSGL